MKLGLDIFCPFTYAERNRRLSEPDTFTTKGTFPEESVESGKCMHEAGHSNDSGDFAAVLSHELTWTFFQGDN